MNKETAVVYIFFIRNTLIVCGLPYAGIEKKLTMRRLSSRKVKTTFLYTAALDTESQHQLYIAYGVTPRAQNNMIYIGI